MHPIFYAEILFLHLTSVCTNEFAVQKEKGQIPNSCLTKTESKFNGMDISVVPRNGKDISIVPRNGKDISVGLVWFLLFNGISTFVGYLMPKPSF